MIFRGCFGALKMCSELACNNVKSLSNFSSVKSDMKSVYEKAIATLNTLQTPYESRDQNKDDIKRRPESLTPGVKFSTIRSLPVDYLDKLSVIHVGGTKGKGSVCAFCESILRNSGYKTGFYSSPHLFEVRERIRINGKPISKKLFTRYFWECWENFEIEKKYYYTTFLVFMAFHVFLKEMVDVAVIEVGCGGEYDSTNVLRHPVVCGITLLDKDHLRYLGGSVESIAWHKSGIFKPGVPALTVAQNTQSMKVLAERARERKASLKIVPGLSTDADGNFPILGIQGNHQHQNASLAVHLCRTWIECMTDRGKFAVNENECEIPTYADVFPLPESFREGLENTVWPGRSQCIERENFTFYVDGAHTRKSIEACSEWFCERSNEEKLRGKSHKTMAKVLIFNFKGGRDARSLLKPLVKCDFDYVIFCPNLLEDEPQSKSSDTCAFSQDIEADKKKCYENEEIWREVLNSSVSSLHTSEDSTRVFPCVSDAFNWLVADPQVSETSLRDVITRVDHLQVFVTGSLYLVGMVLKLLMTELEDESRDE